MGRWSKEGKKSSPSAPDNTGQLLNYLQGVPVGYKMLEDGGLKQYACNYGKFLFNLCDVCRGIAAHVGTWVVSAGQVDIYGDLANEHNTSI